MILFVAAAHAFEPTMCDPRRDTAPVTAEGYCVDAETYGELGHLRQEVTALRSTVAAREAEISAFDKWKEARDEEFKATLAAVREEVDRMEAQHVAELSEARRRTPLEKNGVAVGIVLGSVTTIGITYLALAAYGSILSP